MPVAPPLAEAPRFPLRTATGLALAVCAFLGVADASYDLHHGGNPALALLELASVAVLVATAYHCWRESVRAQGHATRLVRCLDRAEADAERWRREAANVLPALGAAVQRQLERWQLTEDEKQLSMFLLGGQSLQEIAQLLGRTTAAVRKQTLSIYAKAGVGGRAALSAFFLSDLFYLVGFPIPQPPPAGDALPHHSHAPQSPRL